MEPKVEQKKMKKRNEKTKIENGYESEKKMKPKSDNKKWNRRWEWKMKLKIENKNVCGNADENFVRPQEFIPDPIWHYPEFPPVVSARYKYVPADYPKQQQSVS